MVLRSDREGVMRPEEALDFIFGWTEGPEADLDDSKGSGPI